MSWIRYRFKADADDYRPVTFPPPGPYWCSGYGEDHSIVIAYLPPDVDLTAYWPEATDVDATPYADIVYTDRFPRPEWYAETGA